MSKIFILTIVLTSSLLWSCKSTNKEDNIETEQPTAIGLDGTKLFSAEPSAALIQKLEEKKDTFLQDSSDVMNWIWYGRFLAYSGAYEEAEDLYTKAILKYPNDERLYRHRGHRYISTRKLDKAIEDLSKAAELIEGKENKVEPDGMPNAQNIPVSTTHGNIWYHLGLAYYLKHDFENALLTYKKCLDTGDKPDNVVSATHWIYMILNRLDRKEEAISSLDLIHSEMNIIENQAYHKLCLFYKGEITEVELLGEESDAPANDAVLYGLGNYYFYNGNVEKAKQIWQDILKKDSWASFGYIAAESELVHINKRD